ncbi:toll/interleukin-1 receptor domain-containing protein [Aliirhizobium smilacinae]|nr:toll/interleukin-1 receptor domain-containing protein [Rhizobium smilacinae]
MLTRFGTRAEFPGSLSCQNVDDLTFSKRENARTGASMVAAGRIFLSHASEDKDFVQKVYGRLDASSVFYDTKTIAPGQATLNAMEKSVGESSVFVLFHSSHSEKPWVDFEKDQARIHKILDSRTKILVCPIGGASHSSLPDWMKRYWTTTADYKVNDIVRAIIHLQDQTLIDAGVPKEIFVGREDLTRGIELDILSAPTQVGTPLQHLILAGIPGMGRTSVARSVVNTSFSGMRPAGPVFDLPDMAEAADIHLRLMEDLDGALSKQEIERQLSAFQRLGPEEQASMVLRSLSHWAKLNQVVVLRTRWGLRDRSRNLKPWLEALFRLSTEVRNLRLVYISERKLPAEILAHVKSARQYEVTDLSEQNIQYILSKKTNSRYFDMDSAVAISKKIRGHPATAHHVAFLTNSGLSLNSMDLNPEPIYAFQDKTLDAIFSSGILEPIQKKILTILGWFPKLPLNLLTELIGSNDRKNLVDKVWDLLDYSLIQLGEGGNYSVPEVVAARIRRDSDMDSASLFTAVRKLIEARIKAGHLEADLIDALIIAVVNLEGVIPEELRSVLTGSNLLSLVTEQFQTAKTLPKKQTEAFRRVYTLSKMAIGMRTSDDAVEQILFTGGDAAIRGGIYPEDIISFMSEKALPSVYYLIGSHAFYIEKDYGKAAKNLSTSLRLKHFRNRNVRLLAKAYIRDQKFSAAKEALDKIPDFQLFRDTGLLVLKIRSLRGMRSFKEAQDLEKQLDVAPDVFAEKSIYLAGRAFRENDFPTARKYILAAKASPKGSRLSIALLECAIAIEEGDLSLLAETVELALAAGRHYDAWQMQARTAIKKRDWGEALALLSRIDRKDYFDLHLESRALQIKKEEADIARDPAALAEIDARIEAILVAGYKTIDGYRDV